MPTVGRHKLRLTRARHVGGGGLVYVFVCVCLEHMYPSCAT